MFTPEQKRALLIGFGLILAVAAILVLIWLGMFLPGFAGEVFRKLAGMMWTPLVLDFSLGPRPRSFPPLDHVSPPN